MIILKDYSSSKSGDGDLIFGVRDGVGVLRGFGVRDGVGVLRGFGVRDGVGVLRGFGVRDGVGVLRGFGVPIFGISLITGAGVLGVGVVTSPIFSA